MKPAKLAQLNFAIKGECRSRLGFLSNCRERFEAKIKLSQQNPYTFCGLGQSLVAPGRNDKAGPYYLRAAIFGRHIPDVQLSYESILMQTNKLLDAVVYFDATLKTWEASKDKNRFTFEVQLPVTC